MRMSLFILPIIVISLSTDIQSQNKEQKDSTRSILLHAALEIMTNSSTCAFISSDENGVARVRMMDAFLPEKDFTIWFGTNPRSGKVNQIKNNPRVTLYYTEKEGKGYVAIYGKASIVDDSMEKKKRWKEEWKAFYPNQNEDYLLIKVSPGWLEIVSESHGIVSTEPTWKAPRVIFDHSIDK